MWTLRLLLCCILLFYCQVKCGRPNTIRLPLYKQTVYNTLNELRSNADYYAKALKYFLGQGNPDIAVSKIDKNVDYLAVMELGFPKHQKFTFNLDTSFSGLWVPSSSCYFSLTCYGKNYYTSKLSIDYVSDIMDDQQHTQTIHYMVETNNLINKESVVKGQMGFDSLWVDENYIPGTHFMEATDMSYDPFHYIVSDGIFGLGFPSPAMKMAPPFFTMIDRGVLDSPEFSLYIGKADESGEILFGGRNVLLYEQDTLRFHPLNSTGYWEINIQEAFFDGKQLCKPMCKAMIDTGTALIAAPIKSLKYIYNHLNLNYTGELAQIQCAELWTMPTLKFIINGQVFSLHPYHYTIQMNSNLCVLAIMESPKDELWIFGNAFLSKVYTIFNVAEMQIGFAGLIPRSHSDFLNPVVSFEKTSL